MEMIKETRIKIALTAFTLDQYINILAIKSSELESLILFYSNFPCVSSTLFDNRIQSLIDFKTRMIDSNFFSEFDFVECPCFIKLFHSKQFDLVWKPWTFNDMPDIIFPKVKSLANGGEPTEERHVNQ